MSDNNRQQPVNRGLEDQAQLELEQQAQSSAAMNLNGLDKDADTSADEMLRQVLGAEVSPQE